MASGLPIVASDLPVHREVCGEALFFGRFSPEELAAQVLKIVNTPDLARRLAGYGRQRSGAFSWSTHVDECIGLAGGPVAKAIPARLAGGATQRPICCG